MNERLREYTAKVGESRIFVPRYHAESCGAPLEMPEEDGSAIIFSDYMGWFERRSDGTLRHLTARGRRLS
jgi:hypothetical protein